MQSLKIFKTFVLLALLSTLTGCKLAVIVAEGGKVVSGSGSECTAGSVCRYAVPDTNFAETFTAVPDTGWAFAGWSSGNKRFCGDEQSNLCSLDATAAAGTAIEALIGDNETWYLEPVFTCITGNCGSVEPPPAPVVCDLSGAGTDLSSAVFEVGAVLPDCNLSYVNLDSAELISANLSGANLTSAILDDVDLSGANLSGANLSRTEMEYADLRNADLSGANLNDAYLYGAYLNGANLRDANMSSAEMRYASLSGADLRGANLEDASLEDASLSGTNLSGADLTRADLIHAVSLSSQNLIDTIFNNTRCPDGSNSNSNPRCGY